MILATIFLRIFGRRPLPPGTDSSDLSTESSDDGSFIFCTGEGCAKTRGDRCVVDFFVVFCFGGHSESSAAPGMVVCDRSGERAATVCLAALVSGAGSMVNS